jgi:hypothetical protein
VAERTKAPHSKCGIPFSGIVSSNLTPTAMFNFLKKPKKGPKNLKEVLNYLKKIEGNLEEISEDLGNLKEKNRNNLQKLGILRYSPFSEVGGDQSFSIALLDEKDNGLVITSHYFRDYNRVYAKPVTKGTSRYSLSEEEKGAIKKAKYGS